MKENRKHPAGRLLWILIFAAMAFLLKLCMPVTAFAAEAGGQEDPGSLSPPGRSGMGEAFGSAYVLGPDDPEGGVMTLSADGSLCTITPGAAHNYDSWDTTEFMVATETGQYAGFCAQPGKETPSGTYQVAELDNDNIKVMLMCGAGGPFEEAFCPALFGGNDWYAYTHAVIGYLYCGDLTGLNEGSAQGILNIRNWTYGVLGLDANSPGLRNDTVIAALEEYTLYVAYNNDQDIVWLEPNKEEIPKGRIEVRKGGAFTGDAAQVSGAVYGIYTDPGCEDLAGSLITDAAGYGVSEELEAGRTYYLKEMEAPFGMRLSEEVYPVALEEGSVRSVPVHPVTDEEWSGRIVVKKTGEAGERLSGAVFGLYEWSGKAGQYRFRENLAEEDLGRYTSGTLYYTKENQGRFFVEEKEAPAGYVCQGWSQEVTLNEEGRDFVYEVPNEPTRYCFIKTDEDGNPLSGCCFELSDRVGNVIDTWVTEETGIHEVTGILHVGETYRLKEISAPIGYRPSEDITFTVEGVMDLITIVVENRKIPGRVQIRKQDAEGQPLEGAVFSIYSTEERSGNEAYEWKGNHYWLLETCGTGPDGVCQFTGLDAAHGYQYLVVERKAADGKTLLKDPIEVGTLPYLSDQAPTAGVWQERDGQIDRYDAAYTVMDGSRFVLPMTGGSGGRNGVWLAAWGGTVLFAALLIREWKKKRRKGGVEDEA